MSRLPFELLLALRYLRPKRTFVSIITLISVLGVALGVAVLIIVISVMSGFDTQMRETVLGFNAHLTVTPVNSTLKNYAAVGAMLSTNRHVKSVSPTVMEQVLLETQPKSGQAQTSAPYVRGIDAQAERQPGFLATHLVEGKFDLHGHGLVLGSVLAGTLRLQVGDHVSLFSPREIQKLRAQRGKAVQEAVLPDDYEVRGVFDVGYYEFNATMIAVSLENAQDMYELGDAVHYLAVMLDDPFMADPMRSRLQRLLGGEFETKTWLEQSPMLAAVTVEKNVMLYILFFIVIVASFGITCTTITFIVMKTREIGLMKALGASNRQVLCVFIGQSVFVSFFGIFTGLAGGLLAIHYRNEFLSFMRHATGWQLFPAEVYGFAQLPALIVPEDIAIICGGSLVICLAAAAFPARYASKLNPVEALRYE